MGIDREIDQGERLFAWQHAPGLDACPHCKEYSMDPEKHWCRNCELSEEQAWAAFYSDEDRW